MRAPRWTLAVAVVSVTALAAAPVASADDSDRSWKPKLLTDTVIAPFHLAGSQGHLYVADGGTSLVQRLRHDGSLETIARGPQPGEVSGVAFSRSGDKMAYTTTNYETGKAALVIKAGGTNMTVNLGRYEEKRNPDGNRHYGIDNPSQCIIDVLGEFASYTGTIESHPYAVARWGDAWVVADAAGNDLVKVTDKGEISTVAVLPVQPLTITAEMAAAEGLPDCFVGQTYKFEPVPTDVEVGPDGKLYVTTLPGGPEGAGSLDGRGSLYRVNPWNGNADRVARGFSGATSVTLMGNGTMFVAELFGGKVTMVKDGKKSTAAELPGAVSVEYANGHLYAGTMAPFDDMGNPIGTGSVVRLW